MVEGKEGKHGCMCRNGRMTIEGLVTCLPPVLLLLDLLLFLLLGQLLQEEGAEGIEGDEEEVNEGEEEVEEDRKEGDSSLRRSKTSGVGR